MHTGFWARGAVGLLLAVSLVSGQTPAFEVASLRPASAGDGPAKGETQGAIAISPGSLNMHNASVREMILTAYNIKDHQLTAPAWMKSDRYDLLAKAPDAAHDDQIRTMLQVLLAERFKLTIHRETKEFAVDALVAGKGAPKLGAKKPEAESSIGIDKGKLLFQNFSMTRLADYLGQRSADRPVVDATGIDGYFDFSVELVPGGSDNVVDVKRAMGQASRDGSLAHMIAEQLGLKLETRKGPAGVVVVDHADRTPAAN